MLYNINKPIYHYKRKLLLSLVPYIVYTDRRTQTTVKLDATKGIVSRLALLMPYDDTPFGCCC